MKDMPLCFGSPATNLRQASRPPAEAPMPITNPICLISLPIGVGKAGRSSFVGVGVTLFGRLSVIIVGFAMRSCRSDDDYQQYHNFW
jgi:hypothetical protein